MAQRSIDLYRLLKGASMVSAAAAKSSTLQSSAAATIDASAATAASFLAAARSSLTHATTPAPRAEYAADVVLAENPLFTPPPPAAPPTPPPTAPPTPNPPPAPPSPPSSPPPRTPPPPARSPPQRKKYTARSRETRVPSSKLGRMWEFGSLTATVGASVMGERVASWFSGSSEEKKTVLSAANAERIADALCKMRGAALKLGQMVSIQDESLLPPEIAGAMARVRQGADLMPADQMKAVLADELGPGWRELVAEFDDEPMAAASIGQVHGAVLADGREVVMKIQYPGIADSIDSDLWNLSRLLLMSNLLPKGLFLENTIDVARRELGWETDYRREAEAMVRYKAFVEASPALAPGFVVPDLIPQLSTGRVLTATRVAGEPLETCVDAPQHVRDSVSARLLDLCLHELFDWAFMQTDPNFANFLYDAESGKIGLVDFGACRFFPRSFVDNYLRVVDASAREDRDAVVHYSRELGFLTGDETQRMVDIQADAVLRLGEPFTIDGAFDFHKQVMTRDINSMLPDMLRYRLTPPPDSSYSLHRKMAGTFLLVGRLRGHIDCRALFQRARNDYVFGRADELAPAEIEAGAVTPRNH